MQKSTSTSAVEQKIEAIKSKESEFTSEIELGRRRRWEVLGLVYEEALEIEASTEDRQALNDIVDRLPELKDKQWLASEKSVFDNLLVAALGYGKTLSKRHYYAGAMKRALAENVPSDTTKFADWVASKGGIIAAAKGAEKRGESDPVGALKAYGKELPQDAEGEVISISIPEEALASGFSVLVVRRIDDDRVEVLKKVGKAHLILAAVRADELTPAQLDRRRKLAIWNLNNYVAKRMGWLRVGPTADDVKHFKEAVADLQLLPGSEDFFSDSPEALGSGNELQIMNLEAAESDPARFLKNAIPLTLVPPGYDPAAPVEKGKKPAWLEAYRRNPPRRRSQAKPKAA